MGRRLKPESHPVLRELEAELLDRAAVAVIATDPEGRVLAWNPHGESLLGWPAEEAIGRPLWELIGGPATGVPTDQITRQVLAGAGWQGEIRARRKDGSQALVLTTVAPLTHADLGGAGMVVVAADIGHRDRHERLLAARTGVTMVLAESTRLREAMPRILREVCEKLGWDVGAIWRVDEDAGVIRLLDMWLRTPSEDAEFHAVSLDTDFSPGIGMPGRVWASGAPAWIPDVSLDGNFPRASVAARAGLHGGFGFPIVLSGKVLGMFEFYSHEIRQPDDELLQTMSVIGSQVGQFMERMEAEAGLRAARDELEAAWEQLETILQGVDEGITVQDPSGRLVYANDASARLVGFESPDPFIGGPARIPIDRLDVRDSEGKPLPFDSFPGQRVLRGEGPNEVLTQLRRVTDGEVRWCLVRATPVLDEAGTLRFAVSIVHDVTDRRRVEEELRFLSEAGDLLASSLDYEATLDRVARLAVSQVGRVPFADWCAIHVVEADGDLRQLAVQHVDPARIQLAAELERRYPSDPDGRTGPRKVVRTGRSELYESIPEAMLTAAAKDGEHLDLLRSLGMRSAMVVPLVVAGKTLGTITFVSAESGRRYGPRELEVAEELARRAAVAVDNSKLFANWQGVARKLQEGLLPPDLPQIPGMEVAGIYRWGAQDEVGGDFYDVFETGDGTWALVIGDVCGKGPEAAAMTGLARHTVRAVAMRERRPSRVLATLNTAIQQQRKDHTFCTVCYVRVKATSSGARLTIGVAGHPLPVVVRADESCETAGRPGSLLGIFPDPALHERSADLGPGDAIVLYTDGVVEANGQDQRFGMVRLEDLLARNAGASAAEMARALDETLAVFSPHGPRDDVAVLVLRVLPETHPRPTEEPP